MIGAIARRFGDRGLPPLRGSWGPIWPICALALFAVLGSLAAPFLLDEEGKIPFRVKVAVTQASALLVSLFIFAVASRRGGVASLGISAFRALDPIWAVLSYLAFIPLYFLVAILWNAALRAFGFDATPQEVLRELPSLEGAALVAVLAVIVLIGPFFEELLFRAFLQTSLQRKLGERMGWILASALFALVHDPVAVIPVFFLGLLFGYLYRRSGRIWVSWTAHALHNGWMAWLWLAWPELRKAL